MCQGHLLLLLVLLQPKRRRLSRCMPVKGVQAPAAAAPM